MEIYWTNDSTAFDYISSYSDKDEVRRLSIDEQTASRLIREFPKEKIFTIARSKDGRTIAVSRRQKEFDAVLLTRLD